MHSEAMKNGIAIIVIVVLLMNCQEPEALTEFTGNEITYTLPSASTYPVSGIATIKEKKDGSSMVFVTLSGTDGKAKLPLHLHLGDISAEGAEIAALLNPVDASTGKSETHLFQLADETALTYKDLLRLEANMKIHLSDTGHERDIILTGTNIGALYGKDIANGRTGGFGICKSE
jgi:hypothetical protein